MKGLTAPQRLGPKAGARALQPPHILVMDDDEDMRELLRLQLKEAGYQVSLAEDAVSAGHRVIEHLPDLIIADYKMPYMDGVEFIRAMRADPAIPDVPVIFITAMENAEELAGRTFGFPLMSKPLLADELLAAVARGLHEGAAPASPA